MCRWVSFSCLNLNEDPGSDYLCSIVTGNTWAALGGSIVIALYNGGPPGVIFELYVPENADRFLYEQHR